MACQFTIRLCKYIEICLHFLVNFKELFQDQIE